MSDIGLAVGMIKAEAGDKIAAASTLEDKLKAAFNTSRNHWMFTEEDIQVRAGVGAVMMDVGEDSEDFKRLKHELKTLQSLNALMSGLPIDMEQLIDESIEPVGIMKIWNEKTA